MNPFQMLQVMRNPQAFIQNAMKNNAVTSNPVAMNALNMAKQGDMKGVESLARNLCKQRNINADDAIKQLKQQIGY